MRVPPERVVSDDIPATFLAEMMFNRGKRFTVFSEEDAVLEAEARKHHNPHPRHFRAANAPVQGRVIHRRSVG